MVAGQFHLLYHLFDFLGPVLVTNQKAVISVYNYQVLHPQGGHHPLRRVNQAVPGVKEHASLALMDIAILVRRLVLLPGGPGTHIIPVKRVVPLYLAHFSKMP